MRRREEIKTIRERSRNEERRKKEHGSKREKQATSFDALPHHGEALSQSAQFRALDLVHGVEHAINTARTVAAGGHVGRTSRNKIIQDFKKM